MRDPQDIPAALLADIQIMIDIAKSESFYGPYVVFINGVWYDQDGKPLPTDDTAQEGS